MSDERAELLQSIEQNTLADLTVEELHAAFLEAYQVVDRALESGRGVALHRIVTRYLETDLPGNWKNLTADKRCRWIQEQSGSGCVPRKRVCAKEIWAEALGREEEPSRRDVLNIRNLMRNIPGWKELPQKQWCGPYGVQRCFERCAIW